ncbi:unnamed protein product [Mytilus coruscus]|uniref:Uncharacterized protein n=1 Tax=Mytilus coruscus TaxID=42192 RepID=A0A6J8CE11_MYTCO|nr:unnamed protein product [Mytilus coruscus]
MRKLYFLGLFSVLVFLTDSSPVRNVQNREFDLHNAMHYAYDRQSLREELGNATVEERKEFIQSIQNDFNDIDALTTKVLGHDWTTELDLTEEEIMILYHLRIMDSYLPNVGGGPRSLFLGDCIEAYMETNYSSFDTFEEARMGAMIQIITCGMVGLRTLENVLDISDLTDSDFECLDTLAAILEKLSRGVAEMFTVGRFFEVIMTIDGGQYNDPESFNKALKGKALSKMDREQGPNGNDMRPPRPGLNDNDMRPPKPGPNGDDTKQPRPGPNGNAMKPPRPSINDDDTKQRPSDKKSFGVNNSDIASRLHRISSIKARKLADTMKDFRSSRLRTW